MKKIITPLFLLAVFVARFSYSQQPCASCPNVGFQMNDFTNWTGGTGSCVPGPTTPICIPMFNVQNNGLNVGTPNQMVSCNGNQPVHTIYNAPANDPMCPNANCPGPLTVLAPGGGGQSARLGNATNGADAEWVQYSFTVDTCNVGFIYQYAIVLENPGHVCNNQPGFCVRLLDSNNVVIPGNCGSYCVTTSTPNTTWLTSSLTCNSQIQYKCWTSVGVDLTPYMGQQMTLRFETFDCTQTGHFGYCYLDASCNKLTLDVNFCPGMPVAILIAPPGYSSYQWLDPNNNPVPPPAGTNDTLIINNPIVGQQYTCNMVSVAGCPTTLVATLVYTTIYDTTTVVNVPCNGLSLGSFTTTGSNGINPYTYTWSNLGGPPLGTQTGNPTVTINNLPAGTYVIHVTDSLGCFTDDTISITEPPPLPDTLFNTYFCTGDSIFSVCAPTGPNIQSYQWQDANGNDYAGATQSCLIVCSSPVCNTAAPNVYDPNTNTLYVYGGISLGSQYFCQLVPTPPLQYPTNCSRRAVFTLNFAEPVPLWLPDSTINVFTPNGDGKNDIFFPYHDVTIRNMYPNNPPNQTYIYAGTVGYYAQDYNLKIYNRWGIKVFEGDLISDHQNKGNWEAIGWDGKINGNPADAGVYYWVATYINRCRPDQKTEQKGYVHLLR
jgi:hypothetical protein